MFFLSFMLYLHSRYANFNFSWCSIFKGFLFINSCISIHMLASKKVWMAEQIPTTEYKNSSKENFPFAPTGGISKSEWSPNGVSNSAQFILNALKVTFLKLLVILMQHWYNQDTWRCSCKTYSVSVWITPNNKGIHAYSWKLVLMYLLSMFQPSLVVGLGTHFL